MREFSAEVYRKRIYKSPQAEEELVARSDLAVRRGYTAGLEGESPAMYDRGTKTCPPPSS